MANVSLLLLVVVVAVVMVVVMGKDVGRCELEVRSAAADNIGAPSGPASYTHLTLPTNIDV